jgi:hypothetical protein
MPIFSTVEHISIPCQSEKQQINIHNEKNKDSLVNYTSQQESLVPGNKRTLNDSDDFTTIEANKSRKKEYNKQKRRKNQVELNWTVNRINIVCPSNLSNEHWFIIVSVSL